MGFGRDDSGEYRKKGTAEERSGMVPDLLYRCCLDPGSGQRAELRGGGAVVRWNFFLPAPEVGICGRSIGSL